MGFLSKIFGSFIPAPQMAMAKAIVIAVIILVLCIYIGALKLQLGTAQGNVARLTGEVAEWKSSTASLEIKVTDQNVAVESWKHAAEVNAQKAAEAIKNAARIASQRQPIIDVAIARGMNPAGKTCDQAVEETKRDLERLQ